MEDKQIVDLYWARSESAISETKNKYGRYCHYISYTILHSDDDAEECVNDTYMRAWDAMPSKRPENLKTFLGKITRNLSLKRYERYNADKRSNGQVDLVLEELEGCIPSCSDVENVVDDIALVETFNRFLAGLKTETRKIFMRRYWYLAPIKEIAADYSISESKVKMTLLRARNELKQILEKEGIEL